MPNTLLRVLGVPTSWAAAVVLTRDEDELVWSVADTDWVTRVLADYDEYKINLTQTPAGSGIFIGSTPDGIEGGTLLHADYYRVVGGVLTSDSQLLGGEDVNTPIDPPMEELGVRSPNRFDFTDFLNTLAIVQTYLPTTDDAMGEQESFAIKTTVGDNGQILVSLQPVGGSKQEFYGRLNVVVSHVAYHNAVLDIENGDRLQVGSTYYKVVAWEDQGGLGEVFAIYLELVS